MLNLSLIRTRNFSLVFTAVFCVFFETISSQISKTCFSPDQYAGQCVELEKCEKLLALRYKEQQTHRIRLYVSLSQCGMVNNKPLVCCTASPYPDDKNKPLGNNNVVQSTTTAPLFTQTNRLVSQTTFRPARTTQLPTRKSECAGSLDNRIFGGSETKIDEMPYTALLAYTRAAGSRSGFFCGGALINRDSVITAAHCTHDAVLSSKNWKLNGVRLGEWDLQQNPDCEDSLTGKKVCAPPVLDLAISRNIVHEGYIAFEKNQLNDIAILKLRNSVDFNDFVRPICLPFNTEDFKNEAFIVGGFGKTEISDSSRLKLKTEVRSVSNAECERVYLNSQQITTSQMCALGEEGKDSCNGDSGQPLIYGNPRTNRLELVGIVSYGPSPCGQFNKPGVYTRIGPYLDWIQRNMS